MSLVSTLENVDVDKGRGFIGFGQQRTRGVQNMAKIADVICEWPLGNSQISFMKDGPELLPDLRT